MLELTKTTQFRKDLKRILKRNLPIRELDAVILTLRKQQPLAAKHHDHELAGNFVGFRECHIQPDWLLIYAVDGDKLVLTTSRTGSHADLFR